MHLINRLLAALLILGGVVAGSGAPAQARTAYCDDDCRTQWELQQADALPRTGFYDAPTPLAWAQAGTLIRQQNTTEYRVGGKPVAATRILYHSRTSAGRDVAASAVVLVPTSTAPHGGWPVVADAHGGSGYGVACAPSLMRDLYHGDQMLRFLARGWAVVAPDYAGLGTTGRDEFTNKTAEANDVINAVRAARQARPALSRHWVLWGHSQGGGAALAVAERQAVRPEQGYLGAVVTSPASDLTAIVKSLAGKPGIGGFLPLVAQGAKVTDPRTRLGEVLSPEALSRLGITAIGCLGVVMSVYGGLSGDHLVRPAFLDEPFFSGFLRENSTGRNPVGGPVLLLQGDADYVVPKSITDRAGVHLCAAGARLDYRTYPGLGHDTYPGVMTGIDDGAMTDILAWTADRFAGKPAGSTCR